MQKDIGHAAFCAAFTICPKSLEMPFIFSHFRPESINRLCDHSFFFRLDYDRKTEICYYATGRQLISFEVFVTYKKRLTITSLFLLI
ncbi:hypothetical protein DL538_19610 [Bacillus subtilis subsp. subtilis]|jgi:hypothetical protein|nr:hypothetical protein DL538_19610 [Bacillus subtilis subsp. subtilis]